MPDPAPSPSSDQALGALYQYLQPRPWSEAWPWSDISVQDWWTDLWNLLVDIWNRIVGMARGLFEGVSNLWGWTGMWISNFWDWLIDKVYWVRNELEAVRGRILSVLTDVWTALTSWITAARDTITNWVTSARDWLYLHLLEVWGWISNHISEARAWLADWITSARNFLRDHIMWLLREVLGYTDEQGVWHPGVVDRVGQWLYSHITAVRDVVVGNIMWLLREVLGYTDEQGVWQNGIVDRVGQWLWSQVLAARDWMGARFQEAQQWFHDEIVDPWTDWLNWVVDRIHETISTWWESVKLWLSSLWQSLVTWFRSDVVDAIQGGLGWIIDRLRGIITDFIGGVFNEGARHSPIGPDDTPAIFGRLLALGLAGVGAVSLLQVGISLLHPTHNMGLGHISAIIFEFTQYRLVCGIFVGAMLGALLRTPAEYYFNRMFRPTIPTWAELQGMARKHELSRDQFNEAMAYHGFSKDWIEHIWHYMWADPRLYDILRLADVATPEGPPEGAELIERLINMGIDPSSPDWWLQMKFMLGGYEDVDIRALVEVVHKRETLEERGRLVTQIRHMFIEGYWDQDTAADALMRAGLRSDQVSYTLLGDSYAAQNSVLDDRVGTATERFRKGQTTLSEYEGELSTYIINPQRVGALLALESARKLTKPKPVVVTPPEPLYLQPAGKARVDAAIVLFRARMMSEANLRAALLREEMPGELVEATLSLESARLLVRPLPRHLLLHPFMRPPRARRGCIAYAPSTAAASSPTRSCYPASRIWGWPPPTLRPCWPMRWLTCSSTRYLPSRPGPCSMRPMRAGRSSASIRYSSGRMSSMKPPLGSAFWIWR